MAEDPAGVTADVVAAVAMVMEEAAAAPAPELLLVMGKDVALFADLQTGQDSFFKQFLSS